MKRRRAFTLIELMVTFAVLAILLALLVPAVLQAREAARRTECKNKLRQFGLAMYNYSDAFRVFPPSMCLDIDDLPSDDCEWSIHARLLPFLDQTAAYRQIQLGLDWDNPLNQATGVPQSRISTMTCPSDPMSGTARYVGPDGGYIFPVNYAFNFGSWLIFDPATNQGGDGCFHPNARIGLGSVSDGISYTLCAAEVKSFQPYFQNTRDPGGDPPTGSSTSISWLACMSDFALGPSPEQNEGHTQWCNGPIAQSGFTTVFSPNSYIRLTVNGVDYDVDIVTRQEGSSTSLVTYSAVTSRSYHPGIVNVLLLDGSVRSVDQGMSLMVWQAMGTRVGNEAVGAY